MIFVSHFSLIKYFNVLKAFLGFKSLNDVIGRTDLLRQVSKASANLDDLDLNPLFVQADPGENKRYCEKQIINDVPNTLDQNIWPEIENHLDKTKIQSDILLQLTFYKSTRYMIIDYYFFKNCIN